MQRLYENLFYSKPVNELFSDESFLNYMLRVEAALAMAQAEHGLIPDSAGKVIEGCCKIENLQLEMLIEQAAAGGNINIPFVKQLTHAVSLKDTDAAKYVHVGATSQDIVDTATSLQLKDALTLIVNDLDVLNKQLVDLIDVHRNTLMIGRSFLQHAKPITFGFKVARWLDGLLQSKQRMERVLLENFQLQLGGAVGTLFSMQDNGLAVSETMCTILQLNMPVVPWHTQRDHFAETATTLGILTGTIGKMAKDISLLMQTEIAEVFEPAAPGRGGSSTMPHKRNPVGCTAILSNARRVPALVSTILSGMVHDHERATGNWHAEWETLASIVQLSAGAVRQACLITNGLEVDSEKMRTNIELTNGLIYAENVSLALTEHMGKAAAHELMENVCREALQNGVHLKELVQKKDVIATYLSRNRIDELFNPENSIGMCNTFIDRILRVSR